MPEKQGILIAYSSVYGNTEVAVEALAGKLADKGIKDIKMYDVSYVQHSKVLAEAFKYSHIVLATTTYNCGIFESMKTFIDSLISHGLKNRKFVLIENGSWMPTCGLTMKTEIEKLAGTEILNEKPFSIKSALKENQLVDLDNVVITIEKSLGM